MKIEVGKSFKGEWQFGFTICDFIYLNKHHLRLDISLFKRHIAIHIK